MNLLNKKFDIVFDARGKFKGKTFTKDKGGVFWELKQKKIISETNYFFFLILQTWIKLIAPQT